MGRHGAGQTTRRSVRISLPLIAIGVLVLAAIGFAIWLWSLKSVTDPVDGRPVDAYAVVVSSPSCTSGSGTTVVDLTLTPVVRSSMSACGRRVGEQVAVQYLEGHPDQLRLAGTTVAHNSPAGRWLPVAIVSAGLLAVIATIVLLRERRQSRHAGAATRVTVAQLRAGGVVGRVPAGSVRTAGGPLDAVGAAADEPADESAEATSRIAIAGFPGPATHPFRSSDIAVEEALFTHRGPEAPDG